GEALGTIWEQVERLLLKIAAEDLDPRIRSKVAPSDLVQRAFLGVQNGIETFVATDFSSFQNWAQTILKHVIIDERRAQFADRRDPMKEVGFNGSAGQAGAAEGQLLAKSSSPSSHFRKVEEYELLTLCRADLSEDYRRVIEFRIQENLEFQEVGLRMNRSAEAAAKLFGRGVIALKDALKKRLSASVSGKSRN
ncbi:MAG: sigma-70 family RNA polymerase sigma factor, partial [Planctomycetota bacterium]|nr:sigma-70 family RNA polymerase sigma factor [Planctomycetota bacterium]